MTTTRNLQLDTWDEGSTQPFLVFNELLTATDAMLQCCVEAITATPPTTPDLGKAWIVDTSATGDWIGQDGDIAVAVQGGWVFYMPEEGWAAYVRNIPGNYQFVSGAWSPGAGGSGVPSVNGITGAVTVAAGTNTTVSTVGSTITINASGVALSNTSAWTKNQYVAPVVNATATGTVTPDASASNNFQLTLTGNLTLANPTNLQTGMVLNFCLDEDATGGRTITLGSLYKWAAGTPPTWSTSASAKNFFSAYYDGTILRCSGGAGYA